ncbi:5-guanidino-2-oxopentanoate decarboxylase [Nocardioides sp. SYSU DS0663]|uniref:5-guanidino-2-oxopentanoate decarboxylase n=1 Tax=Nocardioides sp. SYSU DS0663 TaxID=3416445 RepID=UPI003F4C6777
MNQTNPSTHVAASEKPRTGGEALVAALADHGVEQIFGIPGTHNLAVYAHLSSYGIKHFSPRHEQGAGYAADGYARHSGRVGVCLTTSGPAILNAAAAAAQAYSDSVPVLFISPGLPLQHPGRGNGYLHEIKDQSRAMDSVVAYSHRVTSVEEIPLAVAQAFGAMTNGRPRPVHLEIPLDLLDVEAVAPAVAPVPLQPAAPAQRLVQDAARLLAEATKPGIVVGGGARHAVQELTRLADVLGAPVITTANGKGVLPAGHPLSLGAGVHHPAAADFAAGCDVLLAVGTELAPSDFWIGPLKAHGQLVRIDVDPQQIITNALPDVALVCDAAVGLKELSEAVSGANDTAAADGHQRAATWRERVQEDARNEGRRYLDIVEGMAAALGENGVVSADSAMACYYGALSNLPGHRPGSFLYPTGVGTLGYGLPAAIGAKLAAPDRPVMAMHGDGGLMFSVAELAGAAEAGLSLPVLVVDNGGYGEIRDEQVARGDRPLGVDLGRPDFVGLARSLGCYGLEVPPDGNLADGLAQAITDAFTVDRPTLILVREPQAEGENE